MIAGLTVRAPAGCETAAAAPTSHTAAVEANTNANPRHFATATPARSVFFIPPRIMPPASDLFGVVRTPPHWALNTEHKPQEAKLSMCEGPGQAGETRSDSPPRPRSRESPERSPSFDGSISLHSFQQTAGIEFQRLDDTLQSFERRDGPVVLDAQRHRVEHRPRLLGRSRRALLAVDTAPFLRERLLPYHDQIVTTGPTFYPAVCLFLGLLDHLSGRYDDAEQWFSQALQLHERVRSPLLIAHTHAAWAALLADRDQHDDHTRARVMAQQALDAATAGGYGYIETDARAVLTRLA